MHGISGYETCKQCTKASSPLSVHRGFGHQWFRPQQPPLPPHPIPAPVCESSSRGELRPRPSLLVPSLSPSTSLSCQPPIRTHHISIDPLHTKPIHPTLPTSDSLITDFTLLCPSRYFTPSPRPQHEEPLPAHPPAPAPRRPPVGLGWVQGSPLPLPLLGEIQQAAVFCFAGGNYASKPNKLILQCISGNRWSSTNKLIRQRHKN